MKADYISPQVWKILYSQMNYENALAIRLSLETGLRIGDVVALPVEALNGTKVTFRASKTGKSGEAVISADLARRLRAIAFDGFLFAGRKAGKHRTRQAVYKDLKAIAKKMGVKAQVSPHSARKTYAVSEYKARGLKAVQRDLQHDREETTLIYALADKITESFAPIRSLEDDATVERVAQRVAELLAAKLGVT